MWWCLDCDLESEVVDPRRASKSYCGASTSAEPHGQPIGGHFFVDCLSQATSTLKAMSALKIILHYSDFVYSRCASSSDRGV